MDYQTGYCFSFFNDELLVKEKNGVPAIPSLSDIRSLYADLTYVQQIGLLDGQDCYVANLTHKNIRKGFFFKRIRQLYGCIDDHHFMLGSRAFHILTWLKHNKFCGCCGSPMKMLSEELALKCGNCGYICYPRISPAIIVAVMKNDQILLAHSNRLPAGRYSVIAGFVEPGETLEDCVRREIKEEVGVKVHNIKYFGSQPWPFPDSLMVAFTAQWSSGKISVDNNEIADAGWFTVNSLPANIPDKVSIARRLIDWFIDKNKSAVPI